MPVAQSLRYVIVYNYAQELKVKKYHMKKLLSGIIIFACAALVSGLTGCKTNDNLMRCPELSSAGKHHPVFLAKTQSPKTAKQTDVQAASNKPAPKGGIASLQKGIPINIQLPSNLVQDADGSDDISNTNKLLNQYSNNGVSIQRKENGQAYLHSNSLKSLLLLTSNLSKSMLHPRGYYERRYGGDGGGGRDGVAMAGGIIGLIAFIFSFIPFLDLLAIPLGIVGIILGAVGIRSHRRHLAIMGLVFGFLALLIAPLTIFFYFFASHGAFLFLL